MCILLALLTTVTPVLDVVLSFVLGGVVFSRLLDGLVLYVSEESNSALMLSYVGRCLRPHFLSMPKDLSTIPDDDAGGAYILRVQDDWQDDCR
jgi:hypothetical protein